MASMQSLVVFVAAFVSLAWAQFNINSKVNNIVYYGQGANQKPLLYHCQKPEIDAIALSFVYLFPAQANGLPGTNFGNQCSGAVYAGPGYKGVRDPARDALQSGCPRLAADMAACQRTYGKKMLLALGGAAGDYDISGTAGDYDISGTADGTRFANMLFGLFGPRNKIWVRAGLPRPFDVPGDAVGTAVDGFTLDIEHPSSDGRQAGYVAFAAQVRRLFPASPQAGLVLTAAPQCAVPDASMSRLIAAVAFDAILIQFYNTPACSARAWVSANAGHAPGPRPSGGFTYDAWAAAVAAGASSGARLYIGLPGSPAGAADPSYYLNQTEARGLVRAYFCSSNFGGVALWEATCADENVYQGRAFTQWTKEALTDALADPALRSCRAPAAGEAAGPPG